MIAASKGKVLKADQIGRVKTFCQDIALGGYLLYAFLITEFTLSKTLSGVFGIFLLVLYIFVIALTVVSGASYLIKNKKVFLNEKQQPSDKK